MTPSLAVTRNSKESRGGGRATHAPGSGGPRSGTRQAGAPEGAAHAPPRAPSARTAPDRLTHRHRRVGPRRPPAPRLIARHRRPTERHAPFRARAAGGAHRHAPSSLFSSSPCPLCWRTTNSRRNQQPRRRPSPYPRARSRRSQSRPAPSGFAFEGRERVGGGGWTGPTEVCLLGMVPSDRGSVATAVSTAAAADKLLHGPVSGKKIQKKAPRKVHKAEREKLKRDHLNDLFVELGDMLAEDRQNNGKACILADTTRILRDLLSQVESLRKENSTLQNESHYVTMERDELRDETSALGKEILELQNELRMRLSSNSGWGHGTAESDSANAVFPSPQPVQPPSMASPIIPLQQPVPSQTVIELPYAATPRELKLFPKAGFEPTEDQDATNRVARPQARYPTQAASWPVSLFSGLPGMEDEQCSSTTTGSTTTGRD